MPSAISPPVQGTKSRGCGLKFVTAVLVLVGAGGYLAYHFTGQNGPPAAGCTVQGQDSTLTLSVSQAGNAATIAAVAASRGLPERALTIALATSLQESRLENLPHGDRDSLGLFQQRPSQGWGTDQQILDPVYSSNSFFDSLVKIKGYTGLPVTVAAQRVQKSGYPEAYAQQEADATVLSTALYGHSAGALSCTTGANTPDSAGGRPGSTKTLSTRLTREFGRAVRPRKDGGQARTIAVPSAPSGGAVGDGTRRGWELAQWAVAHAHDLKVEQVSFGGLGWRAAASDKGWQKLKPGTGTSTSGATSSAASGPADGLVRITVAS
jgi:hypothetical protein